MYYVCVSGQSLTVLRNRRVALDVYGGPGSWEKIYRFFRAPIPSVDPSGPWSYNQK